MTLPSLTVQLVQWGKTELTARCVDSLARSGYDGDMEILVYDNDSPGGPGSVESDGRMTLIQGAGNIGFGPAHNHLASEADHELILILNNDTVVLPGALTHLARTLQEEGVGAVTPQYRDFDGSILEMGGYLGPTGEGWQLFRGMRPPTSFRRMSYRAMYGSGACLMLPRRLFLDQGGFDDRYAPAYYEDTDLCLKLAGQGLRTVVQPRAIVYHYEGATSGRDVSTGPKAFQVRNRERFLGRWSDRIGHHPPITTSTAIGHAVAPDDPNGKRILWMAPHLPRFDREAGHARILKMVEALRDAGHGVVYWAEQCFHADRYGAVLEDIGVAWLGSARPYRPGLVERPTAYASAEEALRMVPWDAVVISFPELASRMIPTVRTASPQAAVLVDDVDLHFLRTDRALAAGIETTIVIDKQTELATYAEADGVITASTEESAVLEKELPGLPTWPFAVAADPPSIGADEEAQSLLFLGNFDHHPNVDAVMWWVSELARAVETRVGRPIKLRVVGAGSERFQQMTGGEASVDVAGWVEDLTPEFHRAKVFLAPLRYGAGTKGKILNSIAHGVPVVTTSIGAEGNDDAVLRAIRVADDPPDVAEHVAALLTDDALWREARAAAITAGQTMWDHQDALAREFAEWVVRRTRM